MANSKYVHRPTSVTPIGDKVYLGRRSSDVLSRFEYVKSFEQTSNLLPNTYLVIRIDGRGFHKCVREVQNCRENSDMAAFRLCAIYEFEKPNDRRALDLMNAAAIRVMGELPDIRLAYGISDEFRYD